LSSTPTIVLLFGGRSSEHEISCVTAAGVLSAIDQSRFTVIPVGITKTGHMVLAHEQIAGFALNADHMPEVADNGSRIHWPESPTERELRVTSADGVHTVLGNIDLVFPVLHGPYGEDGTLQGMLEMLDIPYVGSGVLASALCMDKHYTKTVLAAAGLAVAPGRTVHHREIEQNPELGSSIVAELGLPVFVKPARAGSSVGVSKVKSADELGPALALAFGSDSVVLIESGVAGREVELAVLGGRSGQPRVSSVAGEIVFTGREFYDYEAKYLGASGIELSCPAVLTDAELAGLREAAARAFEALGCDDLARVDFFLTEDGAVVNEINTMPGFTPISMFPTLWQQSGMSYSELVTELIELALARAS
jgi:D-alanine-D-alanine ligase